MRMMMMLAVVAAAAAAERACGAAAAAAAEKAPFWSLAFGAASLLKDCVLVVVWAWRRWARPALAWRAARKEEAKKEKKDEEAAAHVAEVDGALARYRRAVRYRDEILEDLRRAEEEVKKMRDLASDAIDNARDASNDADGVINPPPPYPQSMPAGPEGARHRNVSGEGDSRAEEA